MLTKRQKAILHRAIDSARDQGSGKYVDEYGLPLDIVAHVAMYEGIESAVYSEWEGPFSTIHEKNKDFQAYYLNKNLQVLEPYMSEDTYVESKQYDNTVVGFYRPHVYGPILEVLQKLWDLSRLPMDIVNKYFYMSHLRNLMHSLVDQIPTYE